MGDWFQVIADVDADVNEAQQLAADILAWLVTTGIVLAEPTDCVLSRLGHRPGPHYAAAVTEPDPDLHTLRTNGVEIITGRTVFYSIGADTITCPHCQQVTALIDNSGDSTEAWHNLTDTIDAWATAGNGEHRCPNCQRFNGLNDWTWSPPWGFGHLGIRFWNWPPLSPHFLTAVAERLGHRTVHPSGKM